MVRKMLKAYIKVTADKTHFAIDIKHLLLFVYHFAFHYNPPEYNNTSYTTYSLLNFTSIKPISSNVPPSIFHNIHQFTDICTAPIYLTNFTIPQLLFIHHDVLTNNTFH